MRLPLVLSFLVVVLLTGACRQQPAAATADLVIDLVIEPTPPVVGAAIASVTLTGADGTAVGDASVSLRGDMTHAGMVPVLAAADPALASGAGAYRVPFTWTMGGDWIVTVSALLPDGRVVVREFTFTVASS